MDANLQKIIDRIQKLNRLAESNNVNEAASAAAEAQRLMTEHRISDAQLAAESGAEDEEVTSADVLGATGSKTPQSWLVRLAFGVARANGCRITISSSTRDGGRGRIDMYGRPRDLDAAKYLFFAMQHEINRLADAFNAGHRGATLSFKLGAAVEIGERMVAQQQRAMDTLKASADLSKLGSAPANSGASGALMVINRAKAAVDAKIEQVCGGSRATHHTSGPSQLGAFAAGRRAGATVPLGNRGALGAAQKQIR